MTTRTEPPTGKCARIPPGNRLLVAALSYAATGVYVFPCHGVSRVNGEWRCDCGVPECEHPGKHPIGEAAPHGWQDATTEAATIRRWWSAHPNANIGIALGPSGLFVLDCDGADGRASLSGHNVPIGPCVETGKGHHYYFRHEYQGTPLKGTVGFLPGLDARSAGNYVLAPPSRHVSGRFYRWDDGLKPTDVDFPTVPAWIVDELRGAATDDARQRFDTARALQGVKEGGRDDTLWSLACKLRRADVPQDMATRLVLEAAAKCVTKRGKPAPFPPDKAREKVERAYSIYAPAAEVGGDHLFAPRWPDPLATTALHGLAGDFVRAIEPHTEADPVALLLSFLVAFGNTVGRGPHFVAESAEHYTNLYCVLVGTTSKSRKGSSWAQVLRPFMTAEPAWATERVLPGLSSGEGLIWAVRDPIEREEPVKERGRVVDYQTVVEDPGVEDKRLLAAEMEFAMTLRVMRRDGNTLSAVVRTAWDTGNLNTLTKNSPAKATGAHISIFGHITREEVLRHLDTTEAGNGFGNRFLWACVKRSRVLPDGGRIQDVDFAPLVGQLSEAIEFARTIGEMRRDDAARARWHEVYPDLSEGLPGLLGAITARAEAQVMRLACMYALLDLSQTVGREHLEAALAVWRHCEHSAQFIFGDSLGDPTADEILRILRQAEKGMTRTDISNHFGRNKDAKQITRALVRLAESGLAYCAKEPSGQGRPAERWYAVRPGVTKETS